jgi:FkbM family methyltransferase
MSMYFTMKHAIKVAVARIFNLHVSVPKPRTNVKLKMDDTLMARYLGKALPEEPVFVEVGAGAQGSRDFFQTYTGVKPENCHLIEACPSNFEVLAEKYPDSHCHNLAISAENGMVSFYVYDDPAEGGSSRSNTLSREAAVDQFGEGDFREIQVPSRDLGTFFEENSLETVHLLFMNCEGAEYEIFRGSLDFLDNVQFLWLDLHGKWEPFRELKAEKLRIYDLLVDRGFIRIGGHDREEIENAAYHMGFLWEREAAPE